MSFRLALLDRVDALPGVLRKSGIGILRDHIVVVDFRARPFVMTFVVPSDVVTAAGLFGLQRVDSSLCIGQAFVFGMQRDEVGEGGDGLGGDVLIVFGLFGLLVITFASLEKPVGALATV